MHKSIPLDPERVLLDVELSNGSELIRLMCEKVLTAEGVSSEETVDSLYARISERSAHRTLMTTNGALCINVRIDGMEGVRVCFVRPKRSVSYGVEERAISLAILVASPLARPAFGMRVIAEFEAMCDDPMMHAHMMQERSALNLRGWLEARLREDDSPIKAGEIMRPSAGQVGPDMSLPDLTQLMVAHNLDAVGITDKSRRLIGQVTADDLFTMGMPDFFQQLKSIAFIAEFDPLERYFNREKELTAQEVMSEAFAAVPPDATILEVLFFLSVKGHPKVYVIDDAGILLGVIDRIRLIDHVLHF